MVVGLTAAFKHAPYRKKQAGQTIRLKDIFDLDPGPGQNRLKLISGKLEIFIRKILF